MVVPPVAQLDVAGSISAGVVVPPVTAVKSVEKNVIIPAPPPVPILTPSTVQANANTNVIATVGK